MQELKKKQLFFSKCTVFVNNNEVANGVGADRKSSRTAACDIALKKMRKVCYIIKVVNYI